MAEVGKYYVTIMPDMSKFAGAVKSGTSGAGGIASGIGRIFTTGIGVALGNALTSGFSAFMGSLDQGISRIDTINAFPRVMQNIGVDAASSSRAIDMLVKAVDGMPTTLDAAVAATQRFTLANGDVERSAQMFDALNNALLGGGQSAEAQAQALEQISQAYAKGKPDYREWLSMQQNMGPALKMVAESWGMTGDEMRDALSSGTVSMDDFFDTLITLNDEGIDGMASLSEQADVSMANIGTAVANLKNRFAQSWGFIIDEIGQENIANAINGFSSTFRDAFKNDIAPAIGDLVEGFGELANNPIFTGLMERLSAVVGPLGEAFQTLFAPIAEFLSGNGEAFETMFGNIQGALTNLGPALQYFVDAFSYFAEQAGPVVTQILSVLGSTLAGVIPIVIQVGGAFLNIAGTIFQAFSWLINDFPGLVSEVVQKVIGFFTSLPSRIGAIFNSVKTFVVNAFNAIVNFVKSIPNRIVSFFSGIGQRITNAIGNIHFPMPHVSWEEVGLGIKLPKVSWYARGGFVNGAQLIGVGEKGTELIWPSYGSALDKYGAAIAEHMGGAGTTYNVYLNDLRVNDDERIQRDVLQLLTDMQRYSSMNRG